MRGARFQGVRRSVAEREGSVAKAEEAEGEALMILAAIAVLAIAFSIYFWT
jgi:hypothetical protein